MFFVCFLSFTVVRLFVWIVISGPAGRVSSCHLDWKGGPWECVREGQSDNRRRGSPDARDSIEEKLLEGGFSSCDVPISFTRQNLLTNWTRNEAGLRFNVTFAHFPIWSNSCVGGPAGKMYYVAL